MKIVQFLAVIMLMMVPLTSLTKRQRIFEYGRQQGLIQGLQESRALERVHEEQRRLLNEEVEEGRRYRRREEERSRDNENRRRDEDARRGYEDRNYPRRVGYGYGYW